MNETCTAEFGDPRLPERFWSKIQVDHETGCWLWTASKATGGYAGFQTTDGSRRGHRVAYETLVGPVPTGLCLDHLCRVRHCVNPGHLEPVTNRENILRGRAPQAQNAVKSECIRGHALVAGNLVPSGARSGSRRCRTCEMERGRQRLAVIQQARTLLGMNREEYASSFGWSRSIAEAIVESGGRHA